VSGNPPEVETLDDSDVARAVSAWYERPVAPAPTDRDQIMVAINRERHHRRARPATWVAIGLAALVLMTVAALRTWRSSSPDARGAAAIPVRFVLVAPSSASRVTVVGDFNGWDAAATPLRPQTRASDGTSWAADVQVPPGRHAYAFVVVDSRGTRWVADPAAALAPDDGFGTLTSVIVVGPGGAT
jgi:hypothetical protein